MEQQQPSASLSPSPSGSGSRAFALIAIVSVAVVAVAGGAFLWLRAGSDIPNVPIPTLGLTPAGAARPSLAARLLGSRGGVEVHYFDKNEARTGFAPQTDRHILLSCPDDTVPGVRVETAHGDPALFDHVRYWGYEYTMNELQNERAGKRDRELFDGRFWISDGDLATGPDYAYLNTPNMEVGAGKLYYLTIDDQTLDGRPFHVSCFDRDRDGLNDRREVALGTNPDDADSDDDGIVDGNEVTGTAGFRTNPAQADTDGDELQDGTELSRTATVTPDTNPAIFIPDADPATMTDPTDPDTDGGGVSDGAEDVNHNGRVDAGETNPNDPADDPVCGDGRIQQGEACDDGSLNGQPNRCNLTCTGTTTAVCGNGIVESGEQCDDGNAANGDGCSSTCAITTQCSDGLDNADPEDALADQADPGCYSNGNIVTGTYVPNDNDETHVPACGNGALEGGACDDGNAVNGDGCSSICAIEEGWQCSGEPSVCDLVIPSTECTTTDCRIERLLDANGDGTITPAEAALRHAALVEHIGSTLSEDIRLYDVNGDGVIAPNDSLLVGSYRNSHGL